MRANLISAARAGCGADRVSLWRVVRLEVWTSIPTPGRSPSDESKSGKARHVVLTDEGSEFFSRLCVGRTDQELMLRHTDGSAWKASEQGRPMKDACARAKIKSADRHSQLRHTWASHAVMNGVPMLIVAKI